MQRYWIVVATLLLAPCVAIAQVPERVQYVADINSWRMEVFAGVVHPRTVLQGPIREAGFHEPIQMCFLPSGEGLITTGGVIMLLKDRTVRYLAGVPGRPGYQDGPAEQALLGQQLSICPDGKGGAYIGDRSNRCIRRLTPKAGRWVVETVAGDPKKPASELQLARVRDEGVLAPAPKSDVLDGVGKEARFSYLHANVVADATDNAYVIDSDFLRRITPQGKVETLNPRGGTGAPAGLREPLDSAHFRLIMGGGICFGGDGNLYVADRWNHSLRKVDLQNRVVTVAIGPGLATGPGHGYIDGPEKEASFHDSPGHIVWDPYRKRFYANGVDDWGLRTWENGSMKTIAGGGRTNTAVQSPARLAGMHWCGVLAVDPRPPHDIYIWSNHANWKGRIGRLFQVSGAQTGGGR